MIEKGEEKIDSIERAILDRIFAIILGLLIGFRSEENSLIEIPKGSVLDGILSQLQSDKFGMGKLKTIFEKVADLVDDHLDELNEEIQSSFLKWHDDILEILPDENDLPEQPTASQIKDIISEVTIGKADESRLRKILEWIKGLIAKGEGKIDEIQRALLNRLYSIILGILLVTHLEENSGVDISQLTALMGKSEMSKEKEGKFKEIIEWIKAEIEKGEEFLQDFKEEFIDQLISLLLQWMFGGF